jgi:hypothetical protein
MIGYPGRDFLRQLLTKDLFGQACSKTYASFYSIAIYMAIKPYKKKKTRIVEIIADT